MKMKEIYELSKELRKDLHNNPEISGYEKKTKEILINFIKEHTNLEIVDHDKWFYVYKKGNGNKKIGFRADMDAVKLENGNAAHLCGHDGHSATLGGFALILNEYDFNNDIYLIFEYAEENGEGAKNMQNEIDDLKLDEIYAYHNLPGFKKNTVYLKNDTFALSSVGVKITLVGQKTHAAYPELGRNPSYAIAHIIKYIEDYNMKYEAIHEMENDVISFVTPVGSFMGEEAYGVACERANLMFTLRSSDDEISEVFLKELEDYVLSLCSVYELSYDIEYHEAFPETKNDNKLVEEMENTLEKLHIDYEYLSEPMHWSEDYGWFLKNNKGVLIGVGIGENASGLHTSDYEFLDDIMPILWSIYSIKAQC